MSVVGLQVRIPQTEQKSIDLTEVAGVQIKIPHISFSTLDSEFQEKGFQKGRCTVEYLLVEIFI